MSQAIHVEIKDFDSKEPPRGLHLGAESRANACGKVILVGEHAVIYGARAVAIPVLNMRLEIVLQAIPHSRHMRHRNTHKTSHSENLQNVIHDALRLLNCEPFPLRIEGHSKILFGAGLGASAALCVCILRAISRCIDVPLDAFELARFANQLEKRFHGTPSGLDTTTVALEKALLFSKGHEPQILNPGTIHFPEFNKNAAWAFAIIDSGTRSPTLAMVQESAPYFRGAAGELRVQSFDAIAEQTSRGLTDGELEPVQDAMKRASVLLKEIGVVPSLLSDIIERAYQCGVLAAKTTGAGGGGCILCLLNPMTASETLQQLQKEFGFERVHELTLSST